jgi:translation initiation factor 4G
MNICKEKPDNLPPLDVIGLEPTDTSHTMSRGGSGRNRSSNSLSMPPNARPASIGLGFIAPSMAKSTGSGFQMGQFSTSAGKTSEERFAASTGRSVSVSGVPLGGRPPTMIRPVSQSGTGRERTRSKRGTADSSRTSVTGNAGPTMQVSTMGPPIELVAPLEISANRWVAGSTRRNGSGADTDSPEMVDRKVKGLLNKLTMERFDSISDQIIAWANKSEREKDGRTLIQVIKLVFEKATDEATFSEMYARLCRKMMEQISPKVQDDGIKNAEGKPFAGGQLFRKYLLNRCQEDFERGWVAKEATAAAAATKATEDQAVKEANEKTKGEEESELYSDEYYAAAKAKRRGLGLIRFIGELFKLQMLTERIMHECIKKLLGNVENPEEEEIESLCKLLTTVGCLLDTPKARAHLDVYFSRMRELTKNKNVNSRMMFMLQVSVPSLLFYRPMQIDVVFRMLLSSGNADGSLVMPSLPPRRLLKSMKQ